MFPLTRRRKSEEHPLVLFLGAGASSSLGIPTQQALVGSVREDGTLNEDSEVAKWLLNKGLSSELAVYQKLVKMLADELKEKKEALEESATDDKKYVPLHELLKIADALSAPYATGQLGLKFLKDRVSEDGGTIEKVYRELGTCHNLVLNIVNAMVQTTKKDLSDLPDLVGCFDPLFRDVIEPYNREVISIFTTNYDRVLEQFFSLRPRFGVNDGFGSEDRWSRETFEGRQISSDQIRVDLHQLHGSILWKRDRKPPGRLCIDRNFPLTMTTRTEEDYLLELTLPHIEGFNRLDPYGYYHDNLARKLQEANCCLVIGYRILQRDVEIFRAFHKAFNEPRFRLVVVDPWYHSQVRKDSLIRSLCVGFGADSDRVRKVEERITLIPKYFQVKNGQVEVIKDIIQSLTYLER